MVYIAQAYAKAGTQFQGLLQKLCEKFGPKNGIPHQARKRTGIARA